MKDASLEDRWRCSGRYAPTGLRNRALIALLYRTGLRINEALSLYPKDLDLEGGSVRVLNGKGGKSRTVGLDPGRRGHRTLAGGPIPLAGVVPLEVPRCDTGGHEVETHGGASHALGAMT